MPRLELEPASGGRAGLARPRIERIEAPAGHIPPHGGALVDLMVGADERRALAAAASAWPSWVLSPRQLGDLELLLTGAFSPLRGFLGRADHEAVCHTMRLIDGTLWPIPVTLAVTSALAAAVGRGVRVALRDPKHRLLAVLEVESVWQPDRRLEARTVFGTTDPAHPGVAALLRESGPCLGGRVVGIELPAHDDFRALRQTPAALRRRFAQWGWTRVVGFHTREPMHRAQVELVRRAMNATRAGLLVHAAVGADRGDEHFARVRGYEAVLPRCGYLSALALLPLAPRHAGPREALLHAIVHKNHGCTHFIVGRDHASPPRSAAGRAWVPPGAAQALVKAHAEELLITPVILPELVYVQERGGYMPAHEVPAHATVLRFSDADARAQLAFGGGLPAWFTYPEVADELRRQYPARGRQGFTVLVTGDDGASALAAALRARLLERGGRQVTEVERATGETARVVATEVTRHGGIALGVADVADAPALTGLRRGIEAVGGFIHVHLASRGAEGPASAHVRIEARTTGVDAAVDSILRHLDTEGYFASA